jgi:OOP family OmpA-OmpF porin
MLSLSNRLRPLSGRLLLGCLPGLLSLTASAQTRTDPQEGYYMGASVGALKANKMSKGAIIQALQGQGLAVSTTHADDSATGWKLWAGYRFNPYWAIEGGYTSLGSYEFDGQVIADPGAVKATFKADDWNLLAVGIWPINDRYEVFGKAGMGYWRTKLEATGSFSAQNVRTVKTNGTSPVFGVGGVMHLTPYWSARLEWERFHEIGEASGSGRSDIDLTSLGLQYNY